MQVHGHDFSSLASIPGPISGPQRYLYASGSEEKVVRVFEAPSSFLKTLASARGLAPPAGDSTVAGSGKVNPTPYIAVHALSYDVIQKTPFIK